ncbi:MAG: hypothetical protein SV201_04995 [Pseudomonadota bacterium]|nr:hypothetical protein [Pseudomonadota bacterium]
MALFDEKFYLEVIQGYTSEETVKARRNLVVTAFIISVIYILDFKLQDMRIFGLSMEGKSGDTLALIAMGLLFYWGVIYLIQLASDIKIEGELISIFEKEIERLSERLNRAKEEEEQEKELATPKSKWTAGVFTVPSPERLREMAQTNAAVTAYKDQLSRTRATRRLLLVIRYLHRFVPILLTLYANYALGRMLLA